MKAKQIQEIASFSKAWINSVVGKRKDYKKRLIDVIEDLFPANVAKFDPWKMLTIDTWDSGEYGGMGDRLTELIEWNEGCFDLSENAQNAVTCTIRIAMDMIIEQSGGVVGYSIGDIRKFITDNPKYKKLFNKTFELGKMMHQDDSIGVWL